MANDLDATHRSGAPVELFGTRTVETDKLLRRLDIYPRAVQSVAAQDARTLDALESYAAGVNARISEINRDSLGRGAPEFFVFNAPLAPWQPADSLALVKLMALQLSSHLREEVLRARTSLLLPDENRLADILPRYPRCRRRRPAGIRPTCPRHLRRNAVCPRRPRPTVLASCTPGVGRRVERMGGR